MKNNILTKCNCDSKSMIRIGLGIFFLVFGLLKLTNFQWFVDGPYKSFYGLVFPGLIIVLIGILQIIMSIGFFINKYMKTFSTIAIIMFSATILATLPKIFSTFVLPPPAGPPGFLFVATIPLLFMAISLYIDKK